MDQRDVRDTRGSNNGDGKAASSDLLRRFYQEVGRTRVLTRSEQEHLATAIAERRTAIRDLLQRETPLVDRALAGSTKGTVHPGSGFREREAVRILTRARQEATQARSGRSLRRFVAELEEALHAYRMLRDEMIAASLRLVTSLARRYHHPTLSQLDLIQEGMLGLIRAIERYEPQRGIKFSTYAVWWIWQQLARAADNLGATVRTPVHWNQFRRKVKRWAMSSESSVSDAELSQLAADVGLPPEYARAMEQGVPCVSLDAPIGDSDEYALANRAAADASTDPAALNEVRDLGTRMDAALAALPPRESEILRLRFGLAATRSLTLEEIGQRYGVSRERIRQLEARAIQQMRQICRGSGLHEYLH